jgi:hypothetical protein
VLSFLPGDRFLSGHDIPSLLPREWLSNYKTSTNPGDISIARATAQPTPRRTHSLGEQIDLSGRRNHVLEGEAVVLTMPESRPGYANGVPNGHAQPPRPPRPSQSSQAFTRPFTIQEALPYTPFTSIAPIHSSVLNPSLSDLLVLPHLTDRTSRYHSNAQPRIGIPRNRAHRCSHNIRLRGPQCRTPQRTTTFEASRAGLIQPSGSPKPSAVARIVRISSMEWNNPADNRVASSRSARGPVPVLRLILR